MENCTSGLQQCCQLQGWLHKAQSAEMPAPHARHLKAAAGRMIPRGRRGPFAFLSLGFTLMQVIGRWKMEKEMPEAPKRYIPKDAPKKYQGE